MPNNIDDMGTLFVDTIRKLIFPKQPVEWRQPTVVYFDLMQYTMIDIYEFASLLLLLLSLILFIVAWHKLCLYSSKLSMANDMFSEYNVCSLMPCC